MNNASSRILKEAGEPEAMNCDRIKQIAQFCINNLDWDDLGFQEKFQSLSVCLLECVFSLTAKTESTNNVVNEYAKKYMSGDQFASGDTLHDLLQRIDESGGTEVFASNVLHNSQIISGRRKTEICYEIADKLLRMLSINTLEDFQSFGKPDLLEIVLRSVKGFGNAGINYLFMLAGDTNRCKPDVHIHHCIEDAIGEEVSDDECQELLSGVTEKLKSDYPALTVRGLDYLIWNKYQKSSRKNNR